MTDTPYTHKQVIVLRRDLNMRKGKMAAQAAHASMGELLARGQRQATDTGGRIVLELDKEHWGWLQGRFAKIVVGARDLEHLMQIKQEADAAGLPTCLIQDAGFTEFGGVPTYTALAVGPATPERLDPVTGQLQLL